MKKLALAIGLGAYVVFGASSGSLAAYRVDNTAGVAASRESRIAPWSETATNARLLFLNEAFYPEVSGAVTVSIGAHGNQERADMAQANTTSTETQRLLCEGDICPTP
jgi:hypothetical protein